MNRRFFAKRLGGFAAAMGLGGLASVHAVDPSPLIAAWPRGAKKKLVGIEFSMAGGLSAEYPKHVRKTRTYLMPDGTTEESTAVVIGPWARECVRTGGIDLSGKEFHEIGTYYY